MNTKGRIVYAFNETTGEFREFVSAYSLSKFLDVSIHAVQQAQERNGVCRGWRVYDNANRIREKIAALEKQLELIELYEKWG